MKQIDDLSIKKLRSGSQEMSLNFLFYASDYVAWTISSLSWVSVHVKFFKPELFSTDLGEFGLIQNWVLHYRGVTKSNWCTESINISWKADYSGPIIYRCPGVHHYTMSALLQLHTTLAAYCCKIRSFEHFRQGVRGSKFFSREILPSIQINQVQASKVAAV